MPHNHSKSRDQNDSSAGRPSAQSSIKGMSAHFREREKIMKKFLVGSGLLAALLVSWRGDDASAQAPVPPQAAAAQDSQSAMPDPEVLDNGPIHEAFAEPMSLSQQDLEIISKQPPQPVNELPPSEQPEGKNVQWISGYWMFDNGRDDFVWVSGMWRDVPPGRTWIPGEWQEVDNGYQWVSGFWGDAKQEQLTMLPIPPESLEAGPSSPSPGENYLWAPGNWAYQNGDYVWQAGYWYEGNPNWVWVPNHYSYSSRGSVYVNGYWDYPAQNRGLLYAPVYWGSGYRGGYGGFYRPTSVLNTGLLVANLFVNRGYGHYYYGNWGGNYPGYLQPWGYNYGRWGYGGGNQFGYDPLWSTFRWSNRNNWDNNFWNDRNNWDRYSWDGRGRGRGDWDGRGGNRGGRPGDWDGRPGRDGDRNGRPGDGRPGDGRPGDGRGSRDRDGDIADGRGDRDGRGGRDGRGNGLVTTVDDLNRNGRDVIRTRDLSQTDINQYRERAQGRSRRDMISDTNVGATGAIDNAVRGRDGRGGVNGQGRVGIDSQVRQGDRPRGNLQGQVGVDANGQGRPGGRPRGNLEGQLGVDGQTRPDGRNRGQLESRAGVDTNIRTDQGVRARVGADGNTRIGPSEVRGPNPGLDLNNRGQVRREIETGNDEVSRARRNMDQQLRSRANQTPPVDNRTFNRVPGGTQLGDRPRGQVPGNAGRNIEGPIPQRVMRLPSGQEVMPQGQNFRSRPEGSRPQGNYNRGEGRPSVQIPQGGRPSIQSPQRGGSGQRAIQQAPRNIQRSIPNVGSGGGGGGRPQIQGGGGRRGGGKPMGGGGRGAGGGGGGGGRGRGDR